jgi:prevent-host-death family protein
VKTISVTKARSNLYKLLDEAKNSGEPIQITGKRSNGILVSEDDWRAISETLFLLSIPDMRESIRNGLNTPIDECETEIKW